MGLSLGQTCLLMGLTLAAGTISTVLTKLLYQWGVHTSRCGEHKVKKPYFAALLMFIGEVLCLAIHHGKVWYDKRSRGYDVTPETNEGDASDDKTPLLRGNKSINADKPGVAATELQDSAAKVRPPWFYFLGFCSFDLTATVISGVGLLWVPASLYQMLRGGTVVFAAICSKLFLRKQFTWRQIFGLIAVVIGLVVVGLSGQLRSEHDSSAASKASSGHVTLGISLIVLSSLLQGTQSVLEEKYMKASDKYTVEPLELVGMEGLFGTMLCAFILLPVAQAVSGGDCGSAENSKDTLELLHDSGTVTGIMIVYTINIAFFNLLSNLVSKHLSAVHRQLVNASRTVSIWAVELLLYYEVRHSLGENWVTKWSLMQLGGFVLLLGGTMVYGLAKSKPLPSKAQPV